MTVTEEDIVHGPDKSHNAPHCSTERVFWLLQALLYTVSTMHDKLGLLAVFASLTSLSVLKLRLGGINHNKSLKPQTLTS